MENKQETYEFLDRLRDEGFGTMGQQVLSSMLATAEFYDNGGRHQYHIVSRYLKENCTEDDSITYLLYNIQSLYIYISTKIENDSIDDILSSNGHEIKGEELLKKLIKLYDHIALEEERLTANEEMIRRSTEDASNRLQNEYNRVGIEFKEKTNSLSSEMNANAITIVGLFSAIIFVFFGGITALSGVIKEVLSVGNKDDLALPMMLILVIGLVLFDIIFLLLYSVSKIVDKSIGRNVSGWAYPQWSNVEYNEELDKWSVFDFRILEEVWFDKSVGAKTYATSIMVQSGIRAGMINLYKVLFLKFPHITIPNIVMILMIIRLYIKA